MLVLAFCACGGSVEQQSVQSAKTAPAPQQSDPGDEPLSLPKSASFGALIEAINRRPEKDGDTSCLLEPSEAFVLHAPDARAMRPLPPAPEDLNARFEAVPDPVRLLTLWGQVGVEADRLVAVTFTSTRASSTRPLLTALTDQGIVLRSEALQKSPALSRETAIAKLKELSTLKNIVVTAERDVPLADLYAWLSDLEALDVSVALAVMLPEGTKIPEPTPPEANELRCSAPPAETFGEVDITSVQSAIAQIRSALVLCLERERGQGARGGKIQVRLTVAQDGRMQEACIADGALGSGSSERCAVETLGSLQISPPEPAGSQATLVLPLLLQPKPQGPINPVCP